MASDFFNLTEDNFGYHKTVRDAIHGDIKLTRIETAIIDTRTFQRLRGLRQLGTANLTYPSANHTRFEHSIGTVAVAEQIIRAINDNPQTELSIPEHGRHFTRLLALLHDIAHVPFGHTIEDEAKVMATSHDTSRNRINYFIGPGSEIGEILGADLSKMIADHLLAKNEEDISKLPQRYRYAIDIVANTVCADLLDYLKRDSYFAGLKQAYDDRFISYFILSKREPYKNRVVIKIQKGDNRVRWSVLTEVLKLLRLRYELGERIYFHHSKIITSAMVAKAVQASGWTGSEDSEKIFYELTDDELLYKIQTEKKEGDLSHKLVRYLKERKLYKPAYVLPYFIAEPHGLMPEFEELHENKTSREDLENNLCDACDLPQGSIIIYSPQPDMNLKEAKVKVRWTDGVDRPLETIDLMQKGNVESLHQDHRNLWTFYVFIDPAYIEKAHYISEMCAEKWGVNSQMPAEEESMSAMLESLLQAAEEANTELKPSELRQMLSETFKEGADSATKDVFSKFKPEYWKEKIMKFHSEEVSEFKDEEEPTADQDRLPIDKEE